MMQKTIYLIGSTTQQDRRFLTKSAANKVWQKILKQMKEKPNYNIRYYFNKEVWRSNKNDELTCTKTVKLEEWNGLEEIDKLPIQTWIEYTVMDSPEWDSGAGCDTLEDAIKMAKKWQEAGDYADVVKQTLRGHKESTFGASVISEERIPV